MRIDYVDWGIANRFPHRMELNRKLRNTIYIPLMKEIVKHEREHTSGYSFDDFKHDLKWLKNKKLYWKFVFTTPKSWTQFLPLSLSRGKVYVDITLSIFWLVIILLAGGILLLI